MNQNIINANLLIFLGCILGFLTGSITATILWDSNIVGIPFSNEQRIQWETLVTGITAIIAGIFALIAAWYPYHRKIALERAHHLTKLNLMCDEFISSLGFLHFLGCHNLSHIEIVYGIAKEIRQVQMPTIDLPPQVMSDVSELKSACIWINLELHSDVHGYKNNISIDDGGPIEEEALSKADNELEKLLNHLNRLKSSLSDHLPRKSNQ